MPKRDEATWKALLIDLELAGKNDPLLSMARTLASHWRELPPPTLRELSLYWAAPGRWPAWSLEAAVTDEGWRIDAFGPQTGETVTARCLDFSAAAEIIDTLVRMWSAKKEAQR